jgi:hypothetical protein
LSKCWFEYKVYISTAKLANNHQYKINVTACLYSGASSGMLLAFLGPEALRRPYRGPSNPLERPLEQRSWTGVAGEPWLKHKQRFLSLFKLNLTIRFTGITLHDQCVLLN